ncbi:hypothetical protein [Actinomadura parmotrematis]|uniref:Uncharacterized protein n=1 Tax=Actinomadura parmotrematis TaxID=2864039 RepID=A0ABS7FNC4_9ACTN|nr:hypothetical protein [Actinomadura parmotrematis]MBW8481866.1 hypothetical protein [Actinomadura parmotrematis]
MPGYVSVGTGAALPLPAGEWITLDWDREYSDAAGQHVDQGGPSVLAGPARYSLTVALDVRGLPAGTRGQVRAIEVDADDTSRFESGPVLDFAVTGGDAALLYAVAAGALADGRRLRVQVLQSGDTAGTVGGGAKVLFWR